MFQEWEQIEIEIDGEIDVIYQHRTSNIKTRTDPRISIKTHLEELHVTLTAEMISRINNPTAFTQVCFTHFSTQKLKCTYFSVQPKKGSKLCKVWQLSYLEYALRSCHTQHSWISEHSKYTLILLFSDTRQYARFGFTDRLSLAPNRKRRGLFY